jgi:hypothetical protein
MGYNEDSMNILMESLMEALNHNPELLRFRPKQATVACAISEDPLILPAGPDEKQVVTDTMRQARFCAALAEALVIMSAKIHAPGDRAEIAELEDLTPARAVVLVKEHGTYRAASAALGVNRMTLHRLVRKAKKEGMAVGK